MHDFDDLISWEEALAMFPIIREHQKMFHRLVEKAEITQMKVGDNVYYSKTELITVAEKMELSGKKLPRKRNKTIQYAAKDKGGKESRPATILAGITTPMEDLERLIEEIETRLTDEKARETDHGHDTDSFDAVNKEDTEKYQYLAQLQEILQR